VRRAICAAAAATALWLAPSALASGWCGSGETSVDRADVVTGPQVHAVYAVPSDGVDHFVTEAGGIADDAAAIDAWWRTQDPTREPRFDLASFGTCTGLDVSFVRLPQPASAYAGPPNDALQVLADTLAGMGLDDPFKRYLVYYDGPTTSAGICGTGGGDFSVGPGYGVLWLSACPTVPRDSVAAHELLHALGALPVGAPHACPADGGGAGHPCDSSLDVLYPYNTGLPLAQLLLDAGHDDYYAHSGAWADIQDSLWLHRLDLPQLALVVAVQGAGAVASEQPGVLCAATCTTQWDEGAEVTLEATPGPAARFVHWSGGCTGSGPCSLTMTAARSATALFGPLRIAVRTAVTGRGRLVCTPRCTAHFPAGDALSLRAVPAKGWRFARWAGACTGTRPVCRPATDFPFGARAVFVRKRASR
jgi:hypothetical protein